LTGLVLPELIDAKVWRFLSAYAAGSVGEVCQRLKLSGGARRASLSVDRAEMARVAKHFLASLRRGIYAMTEAALAAAVVARRFEIAGKVADAVGFGIIHNLAKAVANRAFFAVPVRIGPLANASRLGKE